MIINLRQVILRTYPKIHKKKHNVNLKIYTFVLHNMYWEWGGERERMYVMSQIYTHIELF